VEAEDIVQDAMLRALKALDGFRGQDAKPWLLAIVRNCCRTVAHKGRSKAAMSLEDAATSNAYIEALTSREPDPEAASIGREQAQSINAAIARLPDEFREVLILRELEELSYREIAEITDAPIGTVMSRLSRGRALLKERWLDAEGSL
jgi:RNA polymerase sigma factor (sigma-70 family)